jgi:uncharacterized membrane protein
MSRLRLIAALVVVVVLTSGCLHDIGAFDAPGQPNRAGRAEDINDRGDIVGWAVLPDDWTPHAFIMNPDVSTQLVDLTPLETGGSRADAVNSLGIVAGTITGTRNASPGRGAKPFVWWGLTGLDVLPLPPGAAAARSVDINDAGTVLVVGLMEDGYNWQGSYLWSPHTRTYTALPSPSPGRLTSPAALDERGGVVGWGYVDDTGNRALAWDPVTLEVHVLPGDRGSRAYDRNERGVIVGEAGSHDERAAVYWPDASSRPIELPGVEARAINDAGQIVGSRATGATTPNWPYMAMLWEPLRGRTTELGDKSGRGSFPEGINASGRSVGVAADLSELDTAVWWDPPPP